MRIPDERPQGRAISAIIIVFWAIVLAGSATAGPPETGSDGRKRPAGNFDVRTLDRTARDSILAAHASDATVLQARRARAQAIQAGLAQLRLATPGAEVIVSILTGSVEVVKNDRGALTEPAPGRSGLDIVLEFLRAHPDV